MALNNAIARLDMPARIRKLPLDERGYPVPKFVQWIDGKPDFRVIDGRFWKIAVERRACWLCGEPLGTHLAFVIGPMCAVNRVSSEPPSHLDCAQFAVKACPFLTQPRRPRNVHDLPEGHEQPGGLMIERNPGVSLVWVTRSYKLFRANGGTLFKIGDPTRLEWYRQGRIASHDEIMASIVTGLPLLREVARQEGPDAMAELEEQITAGLRLVPGPMQREADWP